MTIEQALAEIERITMREKQHLADDERAKVRAVLGEVYRSGRLAEEFSTRGKR